MTERNLWGYDFTPRFHPQRLDEPLKLKKPSRIFVCDMGDLFDPKVPRNCILDVFTIPLRAPQHTYLFLTKRVKRMFRLLSDNDIGRQVRSRVPGRSLTSTFNNVWLGTTITTQREADERIPFLLQIPGKHWISVEPMLEAIKIPARYFVSCGGGNETNWVVCGGMSGPGAVPMDLSAARDLRDQCKAAGVPFFFKQIDKKTPIPADLMVREYPR
jgi:protein gp37